MCYLPIWGGVGRWFAPLHQWRLATWGGGEERVDDDRDDDRGEDDGRRSVDEARVTQVARRADAGCDRHAELFDGCAAVGHVGVRTAPRHELLVWAPQQTAITWRPYASSNNSVSIIANDTIIRVRPIV